MTCVRCLGEVLAKLLSAAGIQVVIHPVLECFKGRVLTTT